jgi:hypothetical protein
VERNEIRKVLLDSSDNRIMKSARLICVGALAVLSLAALTASSTAQSKNTRHHHYKFIDMGTFGGIGELLSRNYTVY